MEKIVDIKCFEHIYPDKTKIEICGIDVTVYKGERVAVLGPSGSGKTTLIKHILGLLSPSSGVVKVFGVDPSKEYNKIRTKIGVVLQNAEDQLIGPTVLEDVMFSPLNYGYTYNDAKQLAEDILKKLAIYDLKDKIIHYLSGGEKRKVALAGALVLSPELLILDEPFSGLDTLSAHEYIKLINSISKEKGISLIVSTHNINLISELADTVYLISSKNKLSKKGTVEEVLYNSKLQEFNLEEPVLVTLLKKINDNGLNLELTANIDKAAKILLNEIRKNN